MEWNNGKERALFHKEQAELRKQYLAAGMTEEQIQALHYDHDGYKQFVFDANDTYGDGRYQRPILPLKHLLIGLDELNGTNAYEENGRSDYRKIHNGVYTYLEKQNELTGDEQYDRLLAEGIAYSLYCKTGFPKTQNIRLHGPPSSYRENAAFAKELYIRSELMAEEIEEAYQSKQSEVEVIDDIDEETVSDEPVIQSEPVEQQPDNSFQTTRFVRMERRPYYVLSNREGDEERIYIGKEENFDEDTGKYDNSDGSLIYATNRPQLFYLLYGKPHPLSQKNYLKTGLYTEEDYAAYNELANGALREILSQNPLVFNASTISVGEPFRYPLKAEEKTEQEEMPEQGVAVSPVYRQYLEAQKLDPKAIVLLRVGDFYEVMGENARTVAEEVGLTLTSREVGLSERVPMCGFANYEKSTLFKMPKGKFEGMVYYIPSGMVRRDENGIRLRLPEDFEVHLKDKSADENIDLSPAELESELAGKTDEDYESIYRRPSEEARKKFEQVEKNLRENLPDEMKNKPNWVVVRTRENKETGRLDKFLIDVHTGKFAESNEPETWTDFDAACKYAKEHGGVALAYALDGTDGIACIDLDHCIGEDGKRSALADEVLAKCGKTYSEQSVSG